MVRWQYFFILYLLQEHTRARTHKRKYTEVDKNDLLENNNDTQLQTHLWTNYIFKNMHAKLVKWKLCKTDNMSSDVSLNITLIMDNN